MKLRVNSNWSHAVLVCSKCSKKIKGGFGADGKQKLSKALRKQLAAKKGRKSHMGIVEVPCLDICPKKAVVVVDTRCPDIWRIVKPEADVARLAREIENWCE